MKRNFSSTGRALAAAVVTAIVAGGGTGLAQTFSSELPCGELVPKRLASLGLNADAVTKTLTQRHERQTNRFVAGMPTNLGWTVWMNLKSCTGKLVVNISEACVINTEYTTGECRLPGIRKN